MTDIANEERLAAGALALQRKRLRRVFFALGICVAVPTLLAVVYYGMLVSVQYESVAVITADSAEVTEGKGSGPGQELEVARAHIHSRAMLDALIEHHGWRDHYQDASVDFRSRLSPEAGSEKTFGYYTGHVELNADSKHTLSVHVFAFSPEKAQKLAEAIVKESERHIAEQATTTREETLAGAEAGVEDARQKLLAAGKAGADDLEMEVARTRLASALRARELGEAEAVRRTGRLAVVAAPSLPTEASRPPRLWNIATVLITALALSGMVLLLGGFVREHAKF